MDIKVYVEVNASFNEDGLMIPKFLVWEDDTTYHIDKVTDIRQAAALKAGGQGDKRQTKLFILREVSKHIG